MLRTRPLLCLALLLALFCLSGLRLGIHLPSHPLSASHQPTQLPTLTSSSHALPSLRNAAILLLCYNRPHYLERTLASLEAVERAGILPVFVSQDGNHSATAAVARSHRVTLWQRPRIPMLKYQSGQAYLAQHYKWALDRIFLERHYSHAIVLEDDMLFSPDFLSYFEQTAWLLQASYTMCAPTYLLAKGAHGLFAGIEGANMQSSQYERYLKRIRYNTRAGVVLEGVEAMVSESYEKEMQALVIRAARNHRNVSSANRKISRRKQPVLFTYTADNFATLAAAFRIWTHPTTIPALQVPRATHKHTAVLRRRGTTFVLASSRWSPYLPDSLRDFFPKSAHFVRGATGESCESACRRDGARCELGLFEFANQVTQRAIAWLLLGITC
ncbi:MAG: hypothetical protein SGPRY_009886 [Prymnesium sp.]